MKKILIMVFLMLVCLVLVIISVRETIYEKAIRLALGERSFIYEVSKDEESKKIDYWLKGYDDTMEVVYEYNQYLLRNNEIYFNGYEINIHFVNKLNDEVYLTYSNRLVNEGRLHDMIDIVYVENITFVNFDKADEQKYRSIKYIVGVNDKNYASILAYFKGVEVAYCVYVSDSSTYDALKKKVMTLKPNCVVYSSPYKK